MTLGSSERPFELLLVEDNPGDARLAQEAIKESQYAVNVALVEDGEAAMEYLRREGEYAAAPVPDLVLLDLRLPKKDGAEVLKEVSQDDALRRIPLVILTGTEAERSLLQTYEIRPNRYVQKPLDLRRFDMLMTQLSVFSQQPINVPGGEIRVGAQRSDRESKKRWWWPFGS